MGTRWFGFQDPKDTLGVTRLDFLGLPLTVRARSDADDWNAAGDENASAGHKCMVEMRAAPDQQATRPAATEKRSIMAKDMATAGGCVLDLTGTW